MGAIAVGREKVADDAGAEGVAKDGSRDEAKGGCHADEGGAALKKWVRRGKSTRENEKSRQKYEKVHKMHIKITK